MKVTDYIDMIFTAFETFCAIALCALVLITGSRVRTEQLEVHATLWL